MEYSLWMTMKRRIKIAYWESGKRRENGKILYNREVFSSEKELKKKVAKHEKRYNRTAKPVSDFKSPNKVVAEYFLNNNKV